MRYLAVALIVLAAAYWFTRPVTFISHFGTYRSPGGTMIVNVTRRELSLVDFTVSDDFGKPITNDYIGSDAMRWFLYWETPTRLWGYGSDIGYFKLFEFGPNREVKITQATAAVPVPKVVWENLPSSLQRNYRSQ